MTKLQLEELVNRHGAIDRAARTAGVPRDRFRQQCRALGVRARRSSGAITLRLPEDRGDLEAEMRWFVMRLVEGELADIDARARAIAESGRVPVAQYETLQGMHERLRQQFVERVEREWKQ